MANDILLFADDTGANVLTQVAYAADTQRTLGNQAGIARSAFVNKVLRQTSFMSVALAQLIVDRTGQSVLDDGDDAVLLANMKKAVNGFIGSNIASATTTTIGSESSGDVVHVTGTTTITSLGTSTTGTKRTVIFDGILTLTYNATSLILPSAANITTSAGSAGVFVCIDGALGYWKCISYSDDVVNKAQLKTYFDTLYSAVGSGSISGVRQTVQSGSVDTSGFANFVSIGTGLNVNIAATTTPIKVHAAGGAISADRLGTISADKTLLLPASSTSYIYEAVATDGTCTSGSTTLAPIYQFGGTPAVTNGQFTYNISEGKGYLGNGTTAPQVYMTFHSEAVTNGTNVTSVVNYALNGKYISGVFSVAATTVYTKNHNIGSVFNDIILQGRLNNSYKWERGLVYYNGATDFGSDQAEDYKSCVVRTRANVLSNFASSIGSSSSNINASGEYNLIIKRAW